MLDGTVRLNDTITTVVVCDQQSVGGDDLPCTTAAKDHDSIFQA